MTSREGVVVVGASGFGRESLDTLEAMQQAGDDFDILGVVDDSPTEQNLARLHARSVAYLGTIGEWLATAPSSRYLLAIGSPAIRSRLVANIETHGLRPFTAVHPSATLGAESTFAEGVVISAGAIVSTNVRLGRHVHVNPGVIIGHDTVAEDFVSINPGAVISGEVLLMRGSLIGAAATVLQQMSVGRDSMVGAGAVVTKDVPDDVTAKGVPARW